MKDIRGLGPLSAAQPDEGAQRGSQGRRALQFLKQRLVAGVYSPGETLPVEGLAAESGVSRQTIIEAMRSLAAEGFINIVPQVGCQVAVHTKEQVGDFFLLFARVEGMLAGLAAERHGEREISRLRSIGAEIGALLSPEIHNAERGERHRLLNHEFHGYIHAMARAPDVARLAKSFWDRSDFHLATTPHASIYADRLELADQEHNSVIERLTARDAEHAEHLMRAHVLGFRADILCRLESTGRPDTGGAD